jgi:hypothetical protein
MVPLAMSELLEGNLEGGLFRWGLRDTCQGQSGNVASVCL